MALPLLPTKMSIPPLPRHRLARPHLRQLLDEGRQTPLTLLSAPAGFGKTTVVLGWLQTVEEPVAWLSLDEEDGDPLRFWRYLLAALARALPEIAGLPDLRDGEGPATAPRTVAAAVIAALAEAETEAVIVLEDYHLVDQPGAGSALIHDSLNYFLDYAPPGIRLVILTRSDPPLRLARRRVQGQVAEIRAVDLRFSRPEVEAFFNDLLALSLSPADVSALLARTEGWAARLQLVALALQPSSPQETRVERHEFIRTLAGSNHYIADYLLEEVLRRQSPGVENFLLQTSILARFDADLCAALTGHPEARAALDRLEEENLFVVPLDQQRRWFRYHQLFRDLLQERLRRQWGEALHRRAGHWYEQHGYLGEAVAHALAARAYEQVAALLEAYGLTLVFRRTEANQVARWLEALPGTLVRERPLLCLVAAWLDLLQMRTLAEIEQRLAEVDQAMEREKTGRVVREHIEAHAQALRAFLARVYRLDFAEAVARSQQVLAALGKEQSDLRALIWDNLTQAYLAQGEMAAAEKGIGELRRLGLESGYYISVLTADFLEALVARARGELTRAEGICREALARAPSSGPQRPLSYAGAVHAVLGTVLYQRDRLKEAASALEKGSELLALTGEHGIYLFALAEWARVRHAQGDGEGALALLAQPGPHRF